MARGSRLSSTSDTDDYLSRRARNNEAVKRSREKARAKARDTHNRVSKLKEENQKLETRIQQLAKELAFLKEVFVAHAGNKNKNDDEIDRIINSVVDNNATSTLNEGLNNAKTELEGNGQRENEDNDQLNVVVMETIQDDGQDHGRWRQDDVSSSH